MLGDTAVAVHSEDPRWNWAIGKHVRLPLTNRLIPIIADDILVDPKFGTGVVKVTPAHDPNDYAVWQRHKGQPDEIDLINILTPDGKLRRPTERQQVRRDETCRRPDAGGGRSEGRGSAGKGRAVRNAGGPQRSEQDAGGAVSERSMVRENGAAGGAGTGSRARREDQVLSPSVMRSSIYRGWVKSAIGR